MENYRLTPDAEEIRIYELFNEHNGNKRAMADALNSQGILTQRNKKWSVQGISAAVKRNPYIKPDITKPAPTISQDNKTPGTGAEEDSHGGITNELTGDYQAEQDTPADEHQHGESGDVTSDIPEGSQSLAPEVVELLTEAHTAGLLREMIELSRSGALSGMADWWEKNRGIAMNTATRPVFKGTRKNTGINISEDILERARSKAASEKALVGKSMSQLCEFLLWKYVGSPEDVLEKPETKDSEEDTN